MKSKEQISCEVENWIAEGDIPTKPGLTAIQVKSPNYGMTDEEILDRNEFIRCYMMQEHTAIMMVPIQETDYDFFVADCEVTDDEYCAFNTVDYQKTQRPFNKYAYAMKKKMERVKEFAINHSSISCPEVRKLEKDRYDAFVEQEFRERLRNFSREYNREVDYERRQYLRQKIIEMNKRIMECDKIWRRYSPPDAWDA